MAAVDVASVVWKIVGHTSAQRIAASSSRRLVVEEREPQDGREGERDAGRERDAREAERRLHERERERDARDQGEEVRERAEAHLPARGEEPPGERDEAPADEADGVALDRERDERDLVGAEPPVLQERRARWARRG